MTTRGNAHCYAASRTELGALQLELFPDINVRATPALARGAATISQCKHCGTLVCVPGHHVDGTPNTHALGRCPSCAHDAGWLRQSPGVGPFHPRTWDLADVVARCPFCGSEWCDETPLSWWHRQDRCYACTTRTRDTSTTPSANHRAAGSTKDDPT